MNVYYEFHDQNGVYYECSLNTIANTRLVANATRVWRETEGTLTFIKNRHSNPMTTIPDMDEFIFVKLRARVLHVGK